MPPDKKSVSSWITDFPGTFTYDGNVLYCHVSEKKISCTKKFQIDQHIKTSIHIAGLQKKGTPVTQRSHEKPPVLMQRRRRTYVSRPDKSSCINTDRVSHYID